jgi:SAM-dependent methyltransferase
MSYQNKITNYQGDCSVLLGSHQLFSDYIKEFSDRSGFGKGLDIGAGPQGPNGKFFTKCLQLDGCDADPLVVHSLPKTYSKRFQYSLGKNELLPYQDQSLDFIICSCVIQHLSSFEELKNGIKEIYRVLKKGGSFYLMFKSGTNDTELTHTNEYYGEVRTFRVFSPSAILKLGQEVGFIPTYSDKLLDDNWIPYCCNTFEKL